MKFHCISTVRNVELFTGTYLVFELLYSLLVCSEERLDQSELHHENCISIAFEGCSPTDISLASGFSFCASCFFVAAY